jgi:hypothetical protein
MDQSIRSLIKQTFDHIECRSQIEEYGRELVDDVELSFALKEQLLFRHEVTNLQRCVFEQKQVIDESCVVCEDDGRRYWDLARKLINELWNMSREIGTLMYVKDQYTKMLVKHDELVAKLFLTEEKLAEASKLTEHQTNVANKSLSSSMTTKKLPTTTETPITDKENRDIHTPDIPSSPPAVAAQKCLTMDTDESIPDPPETAEMNFDTPDSRWSKTQLEADSAKNVHTTQAEELRTSDLPPSFDSLDTTILLHIFLFLDPLDVLNTAQVNIAMYSRVDGLFNPGVGDESHHIVLSNNVSGTHSAESSESRRADPHMSVSGINSSLSMLEPDCTLDTDTRIVSVSSTHAASNASYIESKLSLSNSLISSTGGRGIFSILQPTGKVLGNLGKLSSDIQQEQANQSYQPLNAAMASSMAGKLSDAELNAIILMTERLKLKEDLAARYRLEQDALIAKLEGTESVKQFLIGKVREMEQVLSTSLNNEVKAAQQAESDQEVIAYLDGRVQELERECRNLQSERKRAFQDVDGVMKKMNEKTVVMGDMLQFERQKLLEREREWKLTKKVLVKEVKSLRAQLVSLKNNHNVFM